jgi:hypothetical protein
MRTETEIREYLAELQIARKGVNKWLRVVTSEDEQRALIELSFLEGQIQTIKWMLGEDSAVISVPKSEN